MKISLILILFLSMSIKAQVFEKIENSDVTTDLGYSQGCAWGDFNNDNFPDLYVSNSWINDNNLFYHNNGDGTFIKITEGVVANDPGNSNGCTWGDYNNDGYIDLYVANVNNQKNFFYKNLGNSNFEKVETGEIVHDQNWSYGCAWADFDNDGFLDLFVSNYNGQENSLYHNNHDETFTKIENSVETSEASYSQNCVWADFNNDNYPDLFVSNMRKNFLYKNNQNGSFTKITNGEIVEETANSFGASQGDLNNDGLIDLFVANWNGTNFLYENKGNFVFDKIIEGEIVNEFSNTEGSSFGDIDNDGLLDLFITNDGINFLYKNLGNFKFEKIEDCNINIDGVNSNGTSLTDYNNDGYLDLFIANGGNQTNLLYQNTLITNNWIKIKCIGEISNCSAIGTKIALKTFKSNNYEFWQFREISSQTGGGYGSQNDLVIHFGVGNCSSIDEIIIYWPSGIIQNIKNIDANSLLTVVETKNQVIDFNGFKIFPNPIFSEAEILFQLEAQSNISLNIFSINGTLIKNIINKEKYEKGKYSFLINKNDFLNSESVFLCVLEINKTIITKKILIQ